MDTVEERIEEEQKSEQLKKEQNGIEMTIEADDVITYAIQQNGGRIVRDIYLKNTTEEDRDDLLIRIDSDTDLIQMFELEIQKLRAGEELHLKEKEIKIKINGDYLASLTERISCTNRSTSYSILSLISTSLWVST